MSNVKSNEPDASQFELLVRSVTDYAIFMLDPTGHVTSWNPGAERIKGYSAEEIIGQHFSRFYTPEDRAAGRPRLALAEAAECGRFEDEAWRIRKDGSRFWTMVVIDAIRADDGTLLGFAKVTRDITERKEAELRLEKARERSVQAQKLEALGLLTGGLSHDFNNLLTTITAGAELALRLDDIPRIKSLLETILDAGRRGGGLTRQLLAFARQQPLEIKPLDLPKFFGSVIKLLRPSLRNSIEIGVELSDELWQLETDASQLELALLNLCFNARDAMPDGGLLRLTAANVRLTREDEIDELVGDYVAIAVADNGTGMREETRRRVVEPFFTTKRFGEGTGLGLSQVYGFAKHAGGTLIVVSQIDVGTTVTLYLPAHAPDSAPNTTDSRTR